MATYEVHHSPGYPFYVVERRTDGEAFTSTGSPLRCVAGPYTTNREAADQADALEAAAAATPVHRKGHDDDS